MGSALLLALLCVTQAPQPTVPDPLALTPEQVRAQAELEAAQRATRESIGLEARVEPETLHLMDRATLVVTARYPERVRLFFPHHPELTPFRVLGPAGEPETALQDGQLVSIWRMEIAAMRLGRRKLPGFEIQYENKDAETGTVKTPPVKVSIEPRFDMEKGEVELRGNDPPLQLFAKNWTLIIVLIALGLVAATTVLTLFAVRYVAALPRRGPPPPPPRPAHEIAYERLKEIDDSRRLQLGQLRELTFDLSEVLREYLGNRYAEHILEMTTSELLACLRELSPKGLSIYELEEFMSDTDLVKFANATPTHGECERTRGRLESLVEKTRRSDGEVAQMRAHEEYRRRLEKPAHPFKRTFAALVDLLIFSALSTGIVLAARSLEWTWLYWADGALLLLFLLLKDVYGPGSPGKVLTGLALTPVDDIRSETLEPLARVIRNLPLLLPVAGQTMELVVMAYAADGRRVGDRWAESRVLDKRPDTSEHVFLLLGIATLAMVVVVGYVLPFVWLGV